MERMEIEELKDYYKARVEPYGKSMNEILEECAKETKAYKQLEEENKKLKEENEDLKQIIKLSKSYEEGKNKLKEVYIKNTAKFLDKKFPKINGFMEEDTLQELRDLGEI